VQTHGKLVTLLVGKGYNHFEMLETLANPYGLAGRAALEQMQLMPPIDCNTPKYDDPINDRQAINRWSKDQFISKRLGRLKTLLRAPTGSFTGGFWIGRV
jgi:hypothetical protein